MAKRRGPKKSYTQKDIDYENSPRQVQRRMARNRARAAAVRKYGKKAMQGKEVDHIRMNPGGKLTNKGNTRVISRHANRMKQPKHKGIYR